MTRGMVRAALATIAAAMLAIAGCGELVAGPDAGTDALTVYDAAVHEIDLHYPFFAQIGIDWPGAVATERLNLRATSTDTRLRTTLCTLTGLLRSYHTTLTTPAGSCSYVGTAYPPNFSRTLLTSAVPALRLTRSGQMSYAVIGGDIGYIYIPSFLGQGWGEEIDDVLEAFGPVHGLIIDIRGNGGGNGANALSIASRLADQERIYQYGYFRNGPGHDDFTDGIPQSLGPRGRTHFGGPVALLTNRGNGSAAEDFIAMLRVIPTTFTVGDTTIGNSSNPLWRTLPNGWQLRIPQSMQRTPDGFNAEGVGYPPTIAVRLEQADFDRNHDTIIDRALLELRSR